MTDERGDETGSEGPLHAEGPLDAYVPPTTPERRRRPRPHWRGVAAAVGVVVALGAAVFAVATLTSAGGAGSPEEAVRKLVGAVADEDVLGALEAVAPAERAVLAQRVTALSAELRRLGLLDDRLDLGRLSGLDFEVDGFELAAEALSDDVSAVRITAGTARLGVSAGDLPLGPVARRLLGDSGSIDSPAPTDLADRELRLVAVRSGGEWFVSLGYSLAEALRRDGGGRAERGAPVSPRGEASPEALVRELARAGAALDPRRLVELTAPGESDALHAYAPSFLPAVADGMRRGGVRAEVPTLDLSTRRSGKEARVTIDKIAVRVTTGRGVSNFDYDGRCIRLSGPSGSGTSGEVCRDDPRLGPSGNLSFSYFTLTTVEHGGSWYLSPAGSYLDIVLAGLRTVSREDLDTTQGEEGAFFLLYRLLFPTPFSLLVAGVEGGGASESGCAQGTSDGSTVTVRCPPRPATAFPETPPPPISAPPLPPPPLPPPRPAVAAPSTSPQPNPAGVAPPTVARPPQTTTPAPAPTTLPEPTTTAPQY